VKIFIDFDDVIFNAKIYKADLKKIFAKFGVSEELFSQSYFDYPPNKKSSLIKTYILKRQIKSIKKKISIDGSQLEKEVEKFLTKAEKYLFPDATPFFKKFSKKQLFLISHGNPSFQKKKINNSRISRFFSAVKISRGGKCQEIKKLINQSNHYREKEKCFFLDDRVHYLEEVKKCLPEITAILIQRPEGRYHDSKNRCCDFTVKNLKEAGKIISKFKQE
jgi:FMN phosphatase YigB (HAD superfamily)